MCLARQASSCLLGFSHMKHVTMCARDGCPNQATVSRCTLDPPQCVQCCDCGHHRNKRTSGGSVTRRGQRSEAVQKQRGYVTANYRFLKNLEKELNKRYSAWMWDRHDVWSNDDDFFNINKLVTSSQRMKFCFELAAQYGVMPQDIQSPERRLSTLDYVVQQSAEC